MSQENQAALPLLYESLKWIAYTGRTDYQSARLWQIDHGFTDDQIRAIGQLLFYCPMLNIPKPRDCHLQTVTCRGCGLTFTYYQRTKRRIWCSESCRMKSYRERKKAGLVRSRAYILDHYVPGNRAKSLQQLFKDMDRGRGQFRTR